MSALEKSFQVKESIVFAKAQRFNKTGTAMATAFVSNCGASERRAFIEALMANGVTVHSFGGCLHNKNEEEVSSVAGKYERKMDIMSQYMVRFYTF